MSLVAMECSSNESELFKDESPDLELEPGIVLTRLNELVRKQYFGYLEKLLKENYESWCKNTNEVLQRSHISACAEQLEDKALKSCMMVQMYRKAMVKIIANVRRNTEQCRLQHHLRVLVEKPPMQQSKSTQTDNELLNNFTSRCPMEESNDEFVSPRLQQKMQIFQEIFNTEIAETVAAKETIIKNKLPSCLSRKRKPTRAAPSTSKHLPIQHLDPAETLPQKSISTNCYEVTPSPKCSEKKESDDDIVAQELAQLFSEEKNEIDRMFGFIGNEEPDDPQINIILKEIQNAKLPNEHKSLTTSDIRNLDTEVPQINPATHNYRTQRVELASEDLKRPKVDLSNSVWPCELYLQRKKLSEALFRLLEEDFRWHDIMKWKFVTLFGEDSDDEFATFSPSIDLDETLICSCIKRISPWVVKHLMKPMNDGLIGNRFLFKKLAKKLSRLIIMENQYPGENMIKTVVENFFCIRQAVLSAEDLELPFIICDDNKLFED